jgi:hypothetical protein
MNRRRRRAELRAILFALLLLAVASGAWWLWNGRARALREEAIEGLPDFPAKGVVARRRPARSKAQAAPSQLRPSSTPPAPPASLPARPARDGLALFAQAQGANVAVVQLNAILNTPLFARFEACLPDGLKKLREAAQSLGLDLDRDLDRVAISSAGVALSGFFGDQPLAERLLGDQLEQAGRTTYRDARLFVQPGGTCLAQRGALLLFGPTGGCERLVDQSIDPAPEGAPEPDDELYGDLYLRTDLRSLRDPKDQEARGDPELLTQLVDGLGGLTLRANVWDEVALTIDAPFRSGSDVAALSSLARLGLEAGRTELAEDPVWQALLARSSVSTANRQLHVELALPTEQLFSRLQLPCPAPGPATTTAR